MARLFFLGEKGRQRVSGGLCRVWCQPSAFIREAGCVGHTCSPSCLGGEVGGPPESRSSALAWKTVRQERERESEREKRKRDRWEGGRVEEEQREWRETRREEGTPVCKGIVNCICVSLHMHGGVVFCPVGPG